jgi:ankyrin repeat protein
MLTEAVAGNHYTTARMLCREYGADPRIPSMLGNATALHIAVQNGNRQMCALLLTHVSALIGFDVNRL